METSVELVLPLSLLLIKSCAAVIAFMQTAAKLF